MKVSNKIKAFALCLVATIGVGVGIYANADSVDRTRDCDNFAVVRCGTMSPDEIRAKFTSKSDIAGIYARFGISRAHLDGNYVNGVVWRDGRVTLDNGTVVATNAHTAIRNIRGGAQIGGTNAKYVHANRMGSAQHAFIRLNANGQFVFAIMSPCGNPVEADNVVPNPPTPPTPPTPPVTPQPTPIASCKMLDQPVVTNRTSVTLRGHATAEHGAAIKSYTFTIVDASGKQVFSHVNNTAALTSEVSTTLSAAGTYTAKVQVTSSLGQHVSADCEKQFTIQPEPKKPAVAITKLVKSMKSAIVSVGEEFPYQVTVTNSGETDLKNVAVNDPAPKGVTFLKASAGVIANNTWTHTITELKKGQSETFTITATVKEYLQGETVNTACVDAPEVPGNNDGCDKATIKLKVKACNVTTGVIEEVEPGKENTAPHTTDLEKCSKVHVCDLTTKTVVQVTKKQAEDTSRYVSADSEQCHPKPAPPQPVPALPQTGGNDVIVGSIGLGALVTAGLAYLASRRQG